MLVIYSNKQCENVANEVVQGASAVQSKVIFNPDEINEPSDETLVLCIEKKPLGRETAKIEPKIKGKKIYLIGVGFSFEDMRRKTAELTKNGVEIKNTLCVKKKGLPFFSNEVEEPELSRAKAFGERIASAMTGVRNLQENEKNRIKNYQH